MRFCTNCGTKIENEDAQFCAECGANVGVAVTNNPSVGQQPVPTQTSKKTKVGLIIGIVAVAVIVLAGMGILAVKAFQNAYSARFDDDSYEIDTEYDVDPESGLDSEVNVDPEIDADSEVTTQVPDEPTKQETTESITTPEVAPSDIPYSVDELNKAITVYNNYRNHGVCCEFDYDEIAYGEAWEYMTSSQAEIAVDLLACSCCASIQEAQSHTGKYLAKSMNVTVKPSSLVEYRGILYCILDGEPGVAFNSNDLQISRTAYNKLSVIAGRYSTLDAVLEGHTKIDFEYQDGTYKIVKATDID